LSCADFYVHVSLPEHKGILALQLLCVRQFLGSLHGFNDSLDQSHAQLAFL
jgi:hypothetical protein